jgi:hypothetical protein
MKRKTVLEVAKEHKLLQQFLGEELFKRYLANIRKDGALSHYEGDIYLIYRAFMWGIDKEIRWAKVHVEWVDFLKNPTKLNLYLTRCSNEDYNV